MQTRCPAWAQCKARALPRPLAPPVMNTLLLILANYGDELPRTLSVGTGRFSSLEVLNPFLQTHWNGALNSKEGSGVKGVVLDFTTINIKTDYKVVRFVNKIEDSLLDPDVVGFPNLGNDIRVGHSSRQIFTVNCEMATSHSDKNVRVQFELE